MAGCCKNVDKEEREEKESDPDERVVILARGISSLLHGRGEFGLRRVEDLWITCNSDRCAHLF